MPKNASLLASIISRTQEYDTITRKENGGNHLYNRAVSINSGAFAFLAIPSTHPGSECLVEVIHCTTKECILPTGQVAGSMDNVVDQPTVFLGEMQ
jgi:hypothetical protein